MEIPIVLELLLSVMQYIIIINKNLSRIEQMLTDT